MVSKWWLRMGLVSMFLLAGCVQPTPTSTPTATSSPAVPGYPGPGYPGPAATEVPSTGYPGASTPLAPGAESTPTGPYPAPTSGAVSHLVPL